LNERVFIGLGTNLGDRKANLENAIKAIDKFAEVPNVSQLYDTAPYGYANQGRFLNAAIEIKTEFHPEQLLKSLLGLETLMGRRRGIKNGPRIIDLDLLFYGDWCLETENLTLPHPGISMRKFVLDPLCDLAPDFIHPKLRFTLAELKEHLR
jgi:2-amino-4-hydroxy-6-hydroxymethyldihydropteridine diphosphokinase